MPDKVAQYLTGSACPGQALHSTLSSLATTHTTSSPKLLFPPLCRQSGTCQVLSVICPTAWVAKGLRWTSLKLVVKRHIHSFIFPNSFYFLYLFLWCPWLDRLLFFFLREGKIMCLLLFSSLQGDLQGGLPGWSFVARLKQEGHAERRQRMGSLPPARGILPQDLPGLLWYKKWIDVCVPAPCGRWSLSFSVCSLACLVFYHHILKCPYRP